MLIFQPFSWHKAMKRSEKIIKRRIQSFEKEGVGRATMEAKARLQILQKRIKDLGI